MNRKIHYIMPMAGRGARFSDRGYLFPKPLIEIYGKPFFYWSTQSIYKFVELASVNFIVLQEHVTKYGIDKEILKYYPEAQIHILPDVTEGAVITCMEGIRSIDDDLPILFNDCDHLFKSMQFNLFCKEKFDNTIDGILLTFQSKEPKFSFIEKDLEGNVIRTVEKEVISDEAICGCYYFKNKQLFISAAEEYIKVCNYSEYFMSGVYNMLLKNRKIVKSLKTDFHVSFGVPDEYIKAKNDRCFEELL